MAQAKDYGPTVGAFEAGVLMSMFLSGITTAQAYRYFHNFPNDPKRMKLFVALVWFLEFGHGTILSVALYWLTVLNFNSTTALVNPLKKLCLATILSSITTSMIQCYFAFRVHIICQMRIIPVICVILSVVHLTGQFMLAIGGYKARSITEFKIRWRTVMIAVLSSSTCADVLIASCLCWRFRRRRKEKFLGNTHQLVDRLIMWSLETCLLTSVGMVSMLAMFISTNNYVWMAIFFTISRLFSNSFLASLNGRKILRNTENTVNFLDIEVSDLGQHSIMREYIFKAEVVQISAGTNNISKRHSSPELRQTHRRARSAGV